MRRPLKKRFAPPRLVMLEARDVPATIVALTATNSLISFDSANPAAILSSVPVTGVAANDPLVGIDYRAATGQLYGVARTRLYTINPATGLAAPIANVTAAPLPGASFGVDLNAADQLRVVSDADVNVRFNPTTGAPTVDSALAFAPNDPNAGVNPAVVGIASTLTSANLPMLYGIDANLDILVRIEPANDGVLRTIGPLGVNTSAAVGFDLGPNNVAFASLTVANAPTPVLTSQLYAINLATGSATRIGPIGGAGTVGTLVRDIAVLPPRQIVYGVTSANRLISFDSAHPAVVLSARPVVGLLPREQLAGIDFRPENGRLYALSNFGGVYEVNPATGASQRVATLPVTTIAPARFGFDFNPVADRLRVVSSDDRNYSINVDTGAVTLDQTLAYAPNDPNAGVNPNVVGLGYSNNSAGAVQTALFGIDTILDVLVRVEPPNDGVLHTIGGLGINVSSTSAVGFDIAGAGGPITVLPTALMAVQLDGERISKLYRVNLATGAATLAGPIGLPATNIGEVVTGIAIEPAFVRFGAPQYLAREGSNAAAVISLVRTGDTTGPATVRFMTSDGTATAGFDYSAVSTIVNFAPGESFKTVLVPILDDNLPEVPETVQLELKAVPGGGGTVIGPIRQATLVILDDDSLDLGDDAGRGFAPARPDLVNWFWWNGDQERGDRSRL